MKRALYYLIRLIMYICITVYRYRYFTNTIFFFVSIPPHVSLKNLKLYHSNNNTRHYIRIAVIKYNMIYTHSSTNVIFNVWFHIELYDNRTPFTILIGSITFLLLTRAASTILMDISHALYNLSNRATFI